MFVNKKTEKIDEKIRKISAKCTMENKGKGFIRQKIDN